jgi:lysozyme family protein
MTTFERAIEQVLAHEGGYGRDPADPGGATQFGISDRRDGTIDGLIDVNGDGIGDLPAQGLTREQAIALYRRDYWDRRYEKLPQLLATKLLDVTVHLGKVGGVTVVQRAINDVRRETGGVPVAVDGQFGPQTLMALTLMDPLLALRAIRARQARHYAELMLARPALAKFLPGWMTRAVA